MVRIFAMVTLLYYVFTTMTSVCQCSRVYIFRLTTMPVLNPNIVRLRARNQRYREVPSGCPYILSFEHRRKLGCGGWRYKVSSGQG